MVLTSYFPPDSRVEKEALSLSEKGHTVHIVSYKKNSQKAYEQTKNYIIHRITASNFFRKKLSATALIFPFYFNKWKRIIEKLNQEYNFDVLHIHDLPLSKVGYYFKKKYGCKLVCDQHEFYSNWIKRTAHMNTALGKIISNLSNWTKYENKYLNLSDLVIAVADPLRENYLLNYNILEEKIITVPNTPSKKIYNHNNINKTILNKYKNDYIIFYAGGIDILRGIDTAISALPQIKKRIPNAKIVLCGKIVKPYNPFKTAAEYGVTDSVIFEGWINESELPSYIAASNICFFTPPATSDEINKTIATKIYQYAIMGKPIIVSDARLMKEFVENNKLGISITSKSSKEFTEKTIAFYDNQIELNQSTSKLTSWEDSVSNLIESYTKLDRNNL